MCVSRDSPHISSHTPHPPLQDIAKAEEKRKEKEKDKERGEEKKASDKAKLKAKREASNQKYLLEAEKRK